MEMKKMLHGKKLEKFAQNLEILNNILKPNLVQRFSRIKVCNSLAVRILYMEAKFGPLKKYKKPLTSVELTFFKRTARYILVDHKRNAEILQEFKVEPVDR
jgi:hypothetical protein